MLSGLRLVLAATSAAAAAINADFTPNKRTPTAGDTEIGDGYIRFSVHGFRNAPPGGPDRLLLRPRQKEVSIENLQDGTVYSINLGLGTPPQPVEVIVDTGSSELWVNPDCATATSRRFCAQFPKYMPRESSSFRDLRETGFIQYGMGNVTLRYVNDSVTLGSSTTINSQKFGVAVASSDIPMGILGLGPAISARSANYPFVLDSLASQGHINSRAFTLDLRSVDSPNGAVIFGGVDRTKFIGSLEKRPILNPRDTPRGSDRYYIYMNSLSLTQPSGSITRLFTPAANSPGQAVFLDSGGTLTRLPTSMWRALGQSFPTAVLDESSGFWVVDCDVADQRGSVDFGFGNKTIKVSYSDFIWRYSTFICVLGVLPEDRGEPVLGASFLRAAYVVYDQDNRNLHLAQASECSKTAGASDNSSIIVISSGPDAVPSSTGLCTATVARAGSSTSSSSRPTATGASGGEGCTNCDVATVTVTGPPAATSSKSAGNELGAQRLGVGFGLVVAACLNLWVSW